MISKSELDEHLRREIDAAKPLTREKLDDVLRDHIAFGLQHFEELDEEGKRAVQAAVDTVVESATKATLALEDGRLKRERIRTIAKFQGDHYSVTHVFRSMGEVPADMEPYMTVTESSILAILQDASDVIHDSRKQSPRGRDAFLVAALLIGAIDDSLSALLLLRRGLATQVATLLRAAQEKTELVELFVQNPTYVEIWMDESRRWRELKPGKVRALLGRRDAIPYKYLSEAGAHPTFMSIKQRAALRLPKGEEKGEPKLQIWVGGQRLPWALIPLCVGGITQASLILAVAIGWMQKQQGVPENRERIERADRLLCEFRRDHAIPMLRQMGLPESDLEDLLADDEPTEISDGA